MENGLTGFYQFEQSPRVRGRDALAAAGHFRYVDAPAVRERLIDFSDERSARVTVHLPAMHCIACVWLLENLFRLKPGLGRSQVNFPRKEVSISFDHKVVRLSEVFELLASLGYEPDLRLSNLDSSAKPAEPARLWMQLGVAAFAFGNIMLFSIASYFGLDSASGPGFQKLTGLISLLLAIPVVLFSAADYWRSAWTSLRQRLLNIDVPIAAGILALFAESVFEVAAGRGAGYFDSLTGLLFFLLCGRLFQQRTFDRLTFDRDFRSFFPLSAMREKDGCEERIALSEIRPGDRLAIRNGELIPADARLVEGDAWIDYSFVTGESEPVRKALGDYLYAGGRQAGGVLKIQTVKPVSQSYLASLWNQEIFQKPSDDQSLSTLTNRYSQRFTVAVLAIALGSAAFWWAANPALALNAFAAVLIVACPCALALAAPFALGTAQRLLAMRSVFLKNPSILERLAAANTLVFDKTGTLTSGASRTTWHGPSLTREETRQLASILRQSIHPHAARLQSLLAVADPEPVSGFVEMPGRGMAASVNGHEVSIGSPSWLESRGLSLLPGADEGAAASRVHVGLDGAHRGWFELAGAIRPEIETVLAELSTEHELVLLSGDNDRDRERFARLFGPAAPLHFEQSPLDKLTFIRRLQDGGKRVVMLGDGLNDAGALKQSDVGVAVVENIGAFSPSSDVILPAASVPDIGRITRFAKASVSVVYASFVISTLYNVVGIAIAARGLLAPVICAVLMPLSSVSVVAFACLATRWLGDRILGKADGINDSEAAWGRRNPPGKGAA